MKDGNIKITVTGNGDLMGDEAVSVSAEGKIYSKNGLRYILYEVFGETEQVISGKHTLKIGRNHLEMIRTFKNNKTKFTYALNEKTETEYQSPFGKLFLTVHTTSFELAETENNLLINISYFLKMDNNTLSSGNLKIEAATS